ncbi:hypothetical protein GCM10022204_44510 [Microlunatus aurantiacus]|uniref:Uncharacterized protein n=2 Tax=Microlunatus aurantiacus TaxID=446786 RepID=A0ABP7EJK4_9ACTN
MRTSDRTWGPLLGQVRAISARRLYATCAFRSSIQIIQRTLEELAEQDQRLPVLLSYPDDEVARVCGGGQRSDETFVRQLDQLGIAYVDGLSAHLKDIEAFSVTPAEYVNRYYYGHYTPAGNHCFAMSVARRPIIEWLDPRPHAYLSQAKPTDAGRLAPGDAGADIVYAAANQAWGRGDHVDAYAGVFADHDGHFWRVSRADGVLIR